MSSSAAANFAPPGGVDISNLRYNEDKGEWHKYGVSKAGSILLAAEFARRYSGSGVLSVVGLMAMSPVKPRQLIRRLSLT